MKAFTQFGTIVGLVALIGLPAVAQQPRYKSWQGQAQTTDTAQTDNMTELLKSLRTLTDQAERSRAADPAFLKDLRDLANAYDNPWPLKLLSDDFRDGDFTRNPEWTVTAGSWQVDTRGRFTGLHSIITKPQAATGQPSPTGAQEVVRDMFGTFLKQQQAGQGGQSEQTVRDEHATIFAPVRITNAFVVRLEIASAEGGGRFDFGPSIGPQGDSLYRITYMPEAASGLVLSRVTSAGTQLLASSNGRVMLEDEKSHIVEWKRDRAGKMTIALDGKQVIEATDRQIRSRFDGFLMDNSGGSYWIRSVEISGAR